MSDPPSSSPDSGADHDDTFFGRLAHRIFGSNDRLLKMMDESRLENLRGCEDLEIALEDCQRVRDAMAEAAAAAEAAGDGVDRRRLFAAGSRRDMSVGAAADKSEEVSRKLERKVRIEETVSGMKISRYFGWGAQTTLAGDGDDHPPPSTTTIMDVFGSANVDRESREVNGHPPSSPSSSSLFGASDDTEVRFGVESASRPTTVKSPTRDAATSPRPPPPGCSRESHAIWACRGIALGCGRHVSDLRECFRSGYRIEASRHAAEKDRAAGRPYDEEALRAAVPDCADVQKTLSGCVESRADNLERRVRDRASRERGGSA